MVKLGIIGLGKLGTEHAKNVIFDNPNAELIAACGREETLKRFTDRFPVKYPYTDYDEMLNNPEIDGILIVTSVNTHGEFTVKALEAGKHVFVEKPVGLTLEEAVSVQKAAEARPNLVCMTGYMRRFDPSYAEAKRRIASGAVGEPIVFRGYSLDRDNGVESAPERGDRNGVWYVEMIVHDVDLARWYLGAEAESVWTIGGAYKHKIYEK